MLKYRFMRVALALIFAMASLHSAPVAAQQSLAPQLNPMRGALHFCMLHFFPEIQFSSSDPNRGFDPASGRNFAYDPNRPGWSDTKTGQNICPDPGVGNPMRDALHFCMIHSFPEIQFSSSDPNRGFDPASGRNFVYDPNRPGWTDTKTGQAVCPQEKATTKNEHAMAPKPPETAPLGAALLVGGALLAGGNRSDSTNNTPLVGPCNVGQICFNPASIRTTGPGQTVNFTVYAPGNTGFLQGNMTCSGTASGNPRSWSGSGPSGMFSVTSVSPGSCTIQFSAQNGANGSLSVNF